MVNSNGGKFSMILKNIGISVSILVVLVAVTNYMSSGLTNSDLDIIKNDIKCAEIAVAKNQVAIIEINLRLNTIDLNAAQTAKNVREMRMDIKEIRKGLIAINKKLDQLLFSNE